MEAGKSMLLEKAALDFCQSHTHPVRIESHGVR